MFSRYQFNVGKRKLLFDLLKMGKDVSFLEVRRSQMLFFTRKATQELRIGEQLECGRTAVHYEIEKFKKSRTYADAKRRGRPRKTTLVNDIAY